MTGYRSIATSFICFEIRGTIMLNRLFLGALALMAASIPAMAQDAGGVRLAPGVNRGPVGLARPLPFTQTFVTAHDVQNGMTAADHQAQNQNMIARLRGDAGFLAGFSMGTPLAASRQVPVSTEDGGYQDYGAQGGGHRHRHGGRPIIINNEGPLAVTVGNGNVVQQQSAIGSGPIAQQQVATTPAGGSTGGALNLVTGSGNIIQRAPGGH
jgi:hypothetical protein